MKIFYLLVLFPIVILADDAVYKKVIENFNILRPITLTSKSRVNRTIDPGVYRIVLEKKIGHPQGSLTLWFKKLDTEFSFIVPRKYFKKVFESDNFTLPSKSSGQPYNLTLLIEKKKNKIRDYVDKVERACKINEDVKIEEECHPKLKWVPFEYRKLAEKKGNLYCYRRPEVATRWGKRWDQDSVYVYSQKASIDFVDPRTSDIVGSTTWRDQTIKRTPWKKGRCR